MQYRMRFPKARMHSPHTPPTTPPTMAPVLDELSPDEDEDGSGANALAAVPGGWLVSCCL